MIFRMPSLFSGARFSRARCCVRVNAGPGANQPGSVAVRFAQESSPALRSLVGWPLFFEPVSRDTQAQHSLLARGPNYQLLVSSTQLDFLLRKPRIAPDRNSVRRDESIGVVPADVRALRVTFVSANHDASLSGAGELEGKVNYLVGNDPAVGGRRCLFSRGQKSGPSMKVSM